MFLAFQTLAERLRARKSSALPAIFVGTSVGMAYVFDQGTGPAIVLCAAGLVVWRTLCQQRAMFALALITLCAAPWIVAQHWLNYHIGHSLAAINANAEHFAWPGSPWNPETMSGVYSHASGLKFATYSLQILVGKKGFLLHNPLLLAAVIAGGWLLVQSRRAAEYPEIVCGIAMNVLLWLVYSWGSTNYSGSCISVRWFLPMLAPGFYTLAVYLRERPQAWGEVHIIGVGSVALGLVMWWCGPWYERVVPGFWLILAGMLIGWITYVLRSRWVAWRWRSPMRGNDSLLSAPVGD
jgi:hypothetical protein